MRSRYFLPRSSQELVLVLGVAVLTVLYVMRSIMDAPPKGMKFPPRVPHAIPFVGNAITFGQSPITFLEDCYKKVCARDVLVTVPN
jgi:hypothetical protein